MLEDVFRGCGHQLGMGRTNKNRSLVGHLHILDGDHPVTCECVPFPSRGRSAQSVWIHTESGRDVPNVTGLTRISKADQPQIPSCVACL